MTPCVMRRKGKGEKWKTQSDLILASSRSRIPPFCLFPVFHFPSSYTSLQMAKHLRVFKKTAGKGRGAPCRPVIFPPPVRLGEHGQTDVTEGAPSPAAGLDAAGRANPDCSPGCAVILSAAKNLRGSFAALRMTDTSCFWMVARQVIASQTVTSPSTGLMNNPG